MITICHVQKQAVNLCCIVCYSLHSCSGRPITGAYYHWQIYTGNDNCQFEGTVAIDGDMRNSFDERVGAGKSVGVGNCDPQH